MRIFFTLSMLFLLLSCADKSPQSERDLTFNLPGPDTTILGTIRNNFLSDAGMEGIIPTFTASSKIFRNNVKEIASTLKIVETHEIPSKKITLAFYSYSIGANIFRDTRYLKKINGKWYLVYQYYSSYEDDPFDDGEGDKAKKLLEKAEKWSEESAKAWEL